ncbi:MAG: RNA polymerase sigma factor [Vicinamibacterales bacterium]
MTPEQEHELKLLMVASQHGDRTAYEALLQGLGHVVRLYVCRRVGNTPWADDVVQDVLMSLHRARQTWNPERPFAPWFYAVLKSRMIDAIRQHRRTSDWEEPMDVTPPVVWSQTAEAETIARADLAQAMRQLSPAQRVVIERLKLQEMTVKDVALETGLSEANVKVIAHRGYAVLKRFLAGIGYGH